MKKIVSSLVLIALQTFSAPAVNRYREFLFGVDYYPEQWPESYWERDAQRMQETGVNAVRMAEFAWALMEPREGVYEFALFDRVIAILAKHNIKTILGTPTATPPKWLTQKYPEVLHVFNTGQKANDQSRRHYCYNSPIYRRMSKQIVDKMAEHYRNNPNVIGWQIDNEFNNENPECYSDSCRVAFRGWVKQKYENLNALNQRWGTVFWSQLYSDWNQVDLPFPTTSLHNPSLMLDFKRFISDSVTSYMEDQVNIIRRYRPNDFITQNGAFKNINLYKHDRNLDLQSLAIYPLFSDNPQYGTGASLTLNRGFSERMMIMEQQTGPAGQTYMLRSPRPGEMRLWTFQSIAHGADGIIHFRWRTARRGIEEYWSGVLDQDDVPRARFQDFKQEGAEINKIKGEILDSKLISEIAVIKDFDDEWVYDHQFFTSEVRSTWVYAYLFRAASELKHNIDFVGPQADFGKYKIIFAPFKILMDEELASKLKMFVEQGGTLIMSAHSAVKDRDNTMTEMTVPNRLTDLLGIEVDYFHCYQPPSADKNGLRFADATVLPIDVWADVLKLKTAKVVATWDRDYMKGLPAATENNVGRGKAVYYGSFFNTDAARYLLKRYAAEKDLKPLFADFPKEIEVTRRTKGQNDYYFILNHANESVAVTPGPGFFDLIAGRESSERFTLEPFAYKVLRRSRNTAGVSR
jgi:beta-galactosidase